MARISGSLQEQILRIGISFGDDLMVYVSRLLNDIDDALFPQQIVTSDGRKFQVRRNDVLEGDKSQRMKMEGDKDGGGRKPQKNKQHQLDDAIDEHDLKNLSEDKRMALFKRDAERGIYRGKVLRNKEKGRPLELDRVDIKKKVIIEDKLAEGFEKNPKGIDVAIDNWAKKNVYNNANKKIDFITNRADHIFDNAKELSASPYSPSLSEIKEIRTIKYKLKSSEDAYGGKLKSKVEQHIQQLKKEYPDWNFLVEFK